jgi:membrane-associated protease RseP (regulator of RpoE activity)
VVDFFCTAQLLPPIFPGTLRRHQASINSEAGKSTSTKLGEIVMKNKIHFIRNISFLFLLAIAASSLGIFQSVAKDSDMKNKTGKPGWIGIVIQDLNEKLAQKEKLDSDEGAYVKEVMENSPADSAGIKENDIIIEFNGKKIYDSDDLAKIIRRTDPGTKVSLTLIRNGERKMLEAIVGASKEIRHKKIRMALPGPGFDFCFGNRMLGLEVLTLNDQLGEYFNAPGGEGVLVTEVEKGSAADKSGFKAGDVIIRAAKKSIDGVEKLQRELRKYDEGDKVEIEVIRKGSKKALTVEIEENKASRPDFFYHTPPHIERFQFNEPDDAELNLHLENIQPKLDQIKVEVENSLKNLDYNLGDVRNHAKQLALRHIRCISL